MNYTLVEGTCGANFCNADDSNSTNSTQTDEISDTKRYTIAGILLGFAILAAIVIALLVDPLTR